MKRRILTVALAVAMVVTAFGCGSSRSAGPAAEQEQFGVRMAKMNLWREAMFRFKRAVELNPQDAMAHNNLAVAYEANGDFENAAKAYREAMRLDKSNQHIQKNYSRFVEFTTRDRRRQQRRPSAQTAAAPAATTATPAAEGATAPPAAAPASDPPPAPPASGEPQPASGTEPATPAGGDPSPTGTSPAETPAPVPAPPPQTPNPPGGQR